MGPFERSLAGFGSEVTQNVMDIATVSALLVKQGVVEGLVLVGSPGQPVDTGALRLSWLLENIGILRWRLTSGLAYATAIEDGVGPSGPIRLKSPVGGFHSVELVVLGWDRIVEHAQRQVLREAA